MRYGLTNSEILNTLSALRVPCGDLTAVQIADAIRPNETILFVHHSNLSGITCVTTSRMTVAIVKTRTGNVARIAPAPAFLDMLKASPRLTVSREAQAWHALSRRVANGIVSKLDLPDLHGENDYEGSPYHFNLPENCHVS